MKKMVCMIGIATLFFLLSTPVLADSGSSGSGGGGQSGGNYDVPAEGMVLNRNAGFRISLKVGNKVLGYRDYVKSDAKIYQLAHTEYAGRIFYYQNGLTREQLINQGGFGNNGWRQVDMYTYSSKAVKNFNKLATYFPGLNSFSSWATTNIYTSVSNALIWDENNAAQKKNMTEKYKKYIQTEFKEEIESNKDCDRNNDLTFLIIEPLYAAGTRKGSTVEISYVTATGAAWLGNKYGSTYGNIAEDYIFNQYFGAFMCADRTTWRASSGTNVSYSLGAAPGCNRNSSVGYRTMLNSRQTWGMNLVWLEGITADLCKTEDCYDILTGTDGVSKCTNTNASNVSKYYDKIGGKRECSDQEDPNDYSNLGRRVKKINNNCNVYCIETAYTSFPGNVLPAKTVGTHFTWPSLSNDIYELTMTGERKCQLHANNGITAAELKQCASYTPTIQDLYGDFNAGATLGYEDKEYGKDTISLVKDKNESSCNGCSKVGNASINAINSKKITVNRKVTLKIEPNVYRYVSKDGIPSFKEPSSSKLNLYTDIGYGNLPISMKSDTSKKHTLNLYNVKLGSGNRFGKLISQITKNDPNYYSCTYKTTTITSSCVCPPGTKNAGMDLFPYIASNSPMNCATAQQKFCDIDSPPTPTPGKNRYCPNKPEISIEACLVAGNSYQACYNKYCTGGNPPKYECPKNNTEGFTEYMDITGCVETLIAKGYSQSEAINVCKDVVCPKDSEKIIYRTIDLDAPFPSKNLNGKVSWANNLGLTSGRYPGYNWNSKEVVQSKILNNRNAKGNALYSDQKKPIYVIDLTPELTESIKAYNRKAGKNYADFNLNCKADGSACISSFLHKEYASALTGGTCRNVGQSGFYTCLNE